MSLGGPVLRQHIVEFTTAGVTTDGVLNTTGNPGPYNFTVPDGVAELTVAGCGAGTSGGAGAYQVSALSAGGGGGGRGGEVVLNGKLNVVPGAVLVVTLGAKGTGVSSSDGAYNAGGDTTITNLRPGFMVNGSTLRLKGGGTSNYGWLGSAPTSSTSAVATRGQSQGADGTDGATNTEDFGSVKSPLAGSFGWSPIPQVLNSAGGGGKASAAAGGNGGYASQSYRELGQLYTSTAANLSTDWSIASTGTSSGGGSWGGGGRGAPSFFSGVSPAGGNGDAVGTSASSTDYGAGGGGGGGSGTARRAGGNGGDGYVRFTYWAAD